MKGNVVDFNYAAITAFISLVNDQHRAREMSYAIERLKKERAQCRTNQRLTPSASEAQPSTDAPSVKLGKE